MLKSWEQYFPNSEKLRTRVYKGLNIHLFIQLFIFYLIFIKWIGIPNAVRGEVWARLFNVQRLKQEQDGTPHIILNHYFTNSLVFQENMKKCFLMVWITQQIFDKSIWM